MFNVVLTKRAEKSFNGLSEDVQDKCGDIFDELQYSFAPIRLDVKKIKGMEALTGYVWVIGASSMQLIKSIK